ncbi:Glucose/arabinose dehydrogenase, beta-propeller fold [Acinetobacter marinus]|uniref:Glucose/arabinose dehydrogenase, beta-propeller fold n=2 Tax=Acinetobacter marinus TaxID=281375 RepID=A0A1G6LRC5_9GAMM|nr:Glucose/arabinose dehydrogenase, beta-propeller fold [Acinetobacter marinus]
MDLKFYRQPFSAWRLSESKVNTLKYAGMLFALSGTLLLSACSSPKSTAQTASAQEPSSDNTANASQIQQKYQVEDIATFNEPWAIAKLPDGRLLITERQGKLKLFDPTSKQTLDVQGVPKVAYGGQGGLGDVVVHPHFADNHWVYLSYAVQGQGDYGAEISRAKLDLSNPQQPKLINLEKIWEQVPKMSGQGHYGHRMLFDYEDKLWVASGERQHFDPAQDMTSNLGKILRLNEDGTPAEGNPFAGQAGVAQQIWSLGHRNPLGMALDLQGQLWIVEMGPEGGDELNLIKKGANYGYPLVSEGNHYDGRPIPEHRTRPEFQAPAISWTPVISPSSMIIYQGDQFPLWQGKAVIGGLSSQSIVIVDLTQPVAKEVQRLDMGERIRGVLAANDGTLWIIQDGAQGKLLKMTP